jgi:4'-phosphopantetheinyl transferase
MTGVDIRCHRLELDAARLDALYAFLSAEERARAARFHFDKHRHEFIAARGMLREILGEYLKVDPKSVYFSYNSYGKPAVDGVYFNLSHSGGLALYAVSRTRELGVDVERIDPVFAFEQIPEQFFSRVEVDALRALPESLQLQAFFNCWTRKEAYVKARGLGLSLELHSFDVSLAPGDPAVFLRGAGDWSVEALTPAPGYVAAIVGEGLDL